MSAEFETAIAWLRAEREHYQPAKFDYAAETDKDDDYWVGQQLTNYLQRAEITDTDTDVGVQAVCKLAATAIALMEAIQRRGQRLPKPGVSSGQIDPWA